MVYNTQTSFWLYCVLLENILPLNFYTNTLYPQAFLDCTVKLVKQHDSVFFDKCGDAINMFCLKSFYSLFTNLSVESKQISPTVQKPCQQSEMAYFMLDLLFLIGDSKNSTTLMDDQKFVVGELIPSFPLDRVS